jgi:hypothetical protein
MTSAAMKSTTAVKASTQTRLSARGHSSYGAAMIKAAKGTGVQTGLATCGRRSMTFWYAFRAGMKALISVIQINRAVAEIRPAIIEAAPAAIEDVVVEKRSAMGFKVVVVKKNIVVIPVRSPMVPSPAKAAKEANAKP